MIRAENKTKEQGKNMQVLEKKFESRSNLICYVRMLAPWADGEASCIQGGRPAAEFQLKKIDPDRYSESRNFGHGKITQLSPFIHHGILSLNEVRNHALEKCPQSEKVKTFIRELGWRYFWQTALSANPQWAWHDIESYKTGFNTSDYADHLPEDLVTGKTGIICIDSFIHQLIDTGYVHNHARMYLASYVVHFRRIKWQAGARWFLKHLLDGDLASNNLSWQWIASTFSNKPYIFNLENVEKYFGMLVDTSPQKNKELDATYDELRTRLFPNIRES